MVSTEPAVAHRTGSPYRRRTYLTWLEDLLRHISLRQRPTVEGRSRDVPLQDRLTGSQMGEEVGPCLERRALQGRELELWRARDEGLAAASGSKCIRDVDACRDAKPVDAHLELLVHVRAVADQGRRVANLQVGVYSRVVSDQARGVDAVAGPQVPACDDRTIEMDELRLGDGVDRRDDERKERGRIHVGMVEARVAVHVVEARPREAVEARLRAEVRRLDRAGLEGAARRRVALRARPTLEVGVALPDALHVVVPGRVVDVGARVVVAREAVVRDVRVRDPIELERRAGEDALHREPRRRPPEDVADVRDRRRDGDSGDLLDPVPLREADPAVDAGEVVVADEPLRALERRLRALRADEDVVGGAVAPRDRASRAERARVRRRREDRERDAGDEDAEPERERAATAEAELGGDEAQHLTRRPAPRSGSGGGSGSAA